MPERRLSRRISRHIGHLRNRVLPVIYLGIEVNYQEGKYWIYTDDGSYSLDCYARQLVASPNQNLHPNTSAICSSYAQLLHEDIITWITSWVITQDVKILAAGISIWEGCGTSCQESLAQLASRLWFELDILPFLLHTRGHSADERTCSAVRKAVVWLTGNYAVPSTRILVGFRNEVQVDASGRVHICTLKDYENTVERETWSFLLKQVLIAKQTSLSMIFFNSTPQGGGVAIMRHALIRLFRLLGVNAHWHVAKPQPAVFDITKRKFHNVLQGVADENTVLKEDEKRQYESWIEENIQRYWGAAKGPISLANVIVIDDPQPAALIPQIRALNPKAKIVYRSHIEIRKDLVQNHGGPAQRTWEYLQRWIQLVDIFISHPVSNFVPEEVNRRKLALFPATTDILDGLNKHLGQRDLEHYMSIFNRVCLDQNGGSGIDPGRPYIVQVARFDPSKGIPDCIEAYRQLRSRLDDVLPYKRVPMLVLCGHGSIDDPDGSLIYNETLALLEEEEYQSISNDVVVVRVPPGDQILNSVMRNAYVALQLSHREGFEIKVTEALIKGIPVIAYKAGGIPCQIQHGETGFLVDVGNTHQVAEYLELLLLNPGVRKTMSQKAYVSYNEDNFTVSNAINWLFLANSLLKNQDSQLPPGSEEKMFNDIWREEIQREQDICKEFENCFRLSG